MTKLNITSAEEVGGGKLESGGPALERNWLICLIFANQSKHKLVYQIPAHQERREPALVAFAIRNHKIKLWMTFVLKVCF